MKSFFITICLMCFVFHLNAQQKFEIKNWLKAGTQKLYTPAFGNVKNIDNETYQQSNLLKDFTFNLNAFQVAEGAGISFAGKDFKWESISLKDDSLAVSGIDSNYILLMACYITNDSWMKVKIKISTDALCEIYLDNNLEKSKTASSMSETVLDTKMHAGKHLLLLKMLSTSRQIKLGAIIELEKEFDACKIQTDLNPTRTVTINDVLDGEKINSAMISPSGNYLIVSINETLKGTGKSLPAFVIKDLRTGKDITLFRNLRISQISWLPRTDRFSYTVTADESTSIYLYDVLNAKESLIAEGIKDFSYYKWSPNEEFIVYSDYIEGPKPEELRRIYDNDDRQPGYWGRSYLHLLYPKSGQILRLTSGNLSSNLHDIHPNGTKILFSSNYRDYTQVTFGKQNLYEMDLNTFKVDTIWKDKVYGGNAQYSPDGTKLLVEGGPECFGETGKNVTGRKIPNSYDTQLYLFDLATKQVKPITLKFDPAVNSSYWAPNNDIYLTVTEKDYENLYHYNIKTEKFTKIDIKTEVLDQISYAYNQSFAAYTGTCINTPQKLYLLNLKTRQSTEILFPEKERFTQVVYGQTEDWNFINRNKTTIYGRIYYPLNFDKSKKYPVIVNYYGGTSPTSRAFGGRYPLSVWAANGYIVYVLQPSGSTGFGQDFSALHVNGWGLDAIDDIIDGTKKFLEAHPFADAENVGCIGASYGGFTTMLLQTRTNLFKTAISHAGISSISSYWGIGYWGYSYSSAATANSYPWNRQDIYVKNSPLFNADKFQNSILLLHGTDDTNVPVGESLQYYAALKILGKDVEMVLVEGQNHWILDYKKRLKWHYTIMSWFDKKLKSRPQLWNDMYLDKNQGN